ncbi:MAG: DUF4249 domain-containing protein [Bacteroidetes bacterium]|nr:DUF4249 domain-containing protein [Bacteroidota bacterium]
MNNKIKAAALLLMTLPVAFSCTEKVTIKVGATYTRLVVDGHIATDLTAYDITLTKTADYFYNAPSPKVVNATVEISDGSNTYLLQETSPGNSGIYRTDPSFYGVPGKTYTLMVHLPEAIAGITDYSSSCELVHVARLDSTKAVFHSDFGQKGAWEIRCYAKDPGNEVNYYMFNLYRNGKLLTDSIQKLRVSDDQLFNGSYFDGGVMYLRGDNPDETLTVGDTITLVMSGITKEYNNFIQQCQAAGFNIPFFTGPPANIKGNISNEAIGFFAAYSNSRASAIVK